MGWEFERNEIERQVVRRGIVKTTTSLYDRVFIEGWHGGAWDGFSMRYRTPYPYYIKWGKHAVRTTSALNLFNRKVPSLEDKYKQKIMETAFGYFNSHAGELYR